MARRACVLVALAAALGFELWPGRAQEKVAGQYLAFVGTYTDKTSSKGIYAYRYDAGTGKMTELGLAAETANPSWLVVHPNGRFLYAVNESGKDSKVSAFRIDAASGKLTLLNQVSAVGEDPCYIWIERTGRYAFVANYTSGNVVVFPIGADGKLGAPTANVRDEGPLGPNKERQEAAHAHWIGAVGNTVLVSDLGLDRVLVYAFDPLKGRLLPQPSPGRRRPFVQGALITNPGTGPRHVAISRRMEWPQFLYVLGELDSTISMYGTSKEGIFGGSGHKVRMLPAGFSGRNDAAEIEIHPAGKFLYASNRGHDSIVVYAIDAKEWELNQVEDVPSGGKEPRHFALDPGGKFLLAENQLSDNIVAFRVDPASGKLTPSGETLSVPSPVCLVFVPVK